MNWLKMGSAVAPFLVSILISVVVGALAFRRWIAPGIVEALETSAKTSTQLANLGGMKRKEYVDGQALDKVISKELIMDKLPELEALRLILSPSSWEQVEEMIEDNPAAVISMYEKYGHLLGGAEQKQESYMF